jgi:predicted amidophosphoribosyltransferase
LARALLTQARWRERAFRSARTPAPQETPAKEEAPAEEEPRAVVQYDDALLKTIKRSFKFEDQTDLLATLKSF